MIVLQTVRSLTSFNVPFFGKAPEDDLITKAAKIAYRILEYLFSLIEKGVDYLTRDIEPEPFHIRYKWSIRITLVALSVFGIYMGSLQLKDKMTKYFDSLIPDPIIAGYEKISKAIKWLFSIDNEINPGAQGTDKEDGLGEFIKQKLQNVINGSDDTFEKVEVVESASEEEIIEFSFFNFFRLVDKVKDTCYFGKELTINGASDFINYVSESKIYYLLHLAADCIVNIQKDGNRQMIKLLDYIQEKVGISETSANDLISKALSSFLTFLGLYKLLYKVYGKYRLEILENRI